MTRFPCRAHLMASALIRRSWRLRSISRRSRPLPTRSPLLVFNLVDAINCDGRFAPLVTARLDALGIAYTGCSTSALFETLSKVGPN